MLLNFEAEAKSLRLRPKGTEAEAEAKILALRPVWPRSFTSLILSRYRERRYRPTSNIHVAYTHSGLCSLNTVHSFINYV